MYDPTRPLTSDIPLNNRGDPWDSRPSDDNLPRGGYHDRQLSVVSVDSVAADKALQPQYGYEFQPAQPGPAYTQEPTPTPAANDGYYYSNNYDGQGTTRRPSMAQPHPGASS